MDSNLSQEEIELLMNGMLPEEKLKELEQESTVTQPQEVLGDGNLDDLFTEEIDDPVVEEIPKEKTSFIKKIKQKFKKNKTNQEVQKTDTAIATTETAVTTTADKVDSLESPEKKKNNKVLEKLNNTSSKTLLIVLIVMVVLVVIMSVLLGVVIYKKNKLESLGKVNVSVPTYKANTTNYIFVSQEKPFRDSTLKLIKILVDPVATVFYFDKPLDFMLYEAELKDKEGKIYNMDLSFAEASKPEDSESSFIRFETLDEGIKEFTLTISDLNTGEKVDYAIELNSYPEFLPAKYLPKPIKSKDSNTEIEIVLEDTIFSSSGSIVDYSLHWKNDTETIQMGWKDIDPVELVTITEKNNVIGPTKSYPSTYLFPNNNTILGRMDFAYVKNLNSTVDINFNHLYRQRDINQSIDLSDLPYNFSEDKQKYIDLGDYTLVLEVFGDFDEFCVITYHGEDKSGNRVEMKLEGELTISDGSGMEVAIDGKCRTKVEGGEFKFTTKNAQDIINKLKTKQYKLNLKKAGIKIPDQTISIDLSELNDSNRQMDKKEIENFVTEAFKKRLSVKSGEVAIDELKNYFESYILEDDTIVRDYLQPVNLVEPARYSSQVLAMGKNTDNIYYAVVQDSWKGNENVKETHFYRTHKVVIQNTAGKLAITEDTIIK